MISNKVAVVISPHPDDETLGCGGTLLRLLEKDYSLHWILVTTAEGGDYSPEYVQKQQVQIHNVCRAYPFCSLKWMKYVTSEMEMIPLKEIITKMVAIISEIRPELVFLPHPADAHSDHRIIFSASTSALKPMNMHKFGVKRILSYETLSETDAAVPVQNNSFCPTILVNIERTIERKIKIMNLYETELQGDPLARSSSAVRALARIRGSTCGFMYAEAFTLIREIFDDINEPYFT